MIIGCYTLDLYCDGDKCQKIDDCGRTIVAMFQGYDEATCKRVARKKGWLFRLGKCYCKECR